MKGVFSHEQAATIGHGTTKRTTTSLQYVYVMEEQDEKYSVRVINANNLPTGEAEFISFDQLMHEYTPEPDFYHEKVFPAMRELGKTIARGERHLKNGEPYTAELEFLAALKLDEDNVRATFGLGLAYLERQQVEKADTVFQKLVKMRAAFEREHKHMFNAFGISLRRNRMFSQALKFYARAQQLCGADDHLMFNMARCLCDAGDNDGCCTYLRKALELNPNQKEAATMLRAVEKRKG
ncbi:tetratricopeptide repeat protein [Desulfovibrio mangrovi]|uniref:tetratricopeptide repeat protein n=1 Tax=Desulfovibrio mangrovi TaxID=2976983 RepID=UPI0022466E22|nr:tetratricopeptide repeat protein [Desulfovibrio mangrovi]UZP67828.1 tetratricopeptide repeat protein [Desulfovibrio mangrovi]